MSVHHSSQTIVVIGGGIAGTSCIEALIQDYDQPDSLFNHIVLISEHRLLKNVTNYELTGRNLERFDIALQGPEEIYADIPKGLKLETIVSTVISINTDEKCVQFKTNKNQRDQKLTYDFLCICTGSKPKQSIYSNHVEVQKRVIVIRDTQTVEELKEKLSSCRSLVIVGNGGIGLELVGKIKNCEKVWIIRDASIGLTFFDSGAEKFLLDASTGKHLNFAASAGDTKKNFSSTTFRDTSSTPDDYGPALGPDWLQDIQLVGTADNDKLNIIYNDEVESIEFLDAKTSNYPLLVKTKSKNLHKCDLVALATGVLPNRPKTIQDVIDLDEKDGGILIDEQMRTSVNSIYAAGDVVSCDRWNHKDDWFQMRLWTQARQMGYYSGKCISAHMRGVDPTIYNNFECFTHCTSFFGYKLVLLGRFNGQCLRQDVEDERFDIIARVNPYKDYIKILINHISGRIVGAVIVGESGLAETIENLIHDKIDVSQFKEQLLDNTVDIEDYFD